MRHCNTATSQQRNTADPGTRTPRSIPRPSNTASTVSSTVSLPAIGRSVGRSVRFENRLCFTRSAAVWSVLGHAIGLGDRHAENILLDVTNGECVHVDFDCLFDKGLTLQRPEVCPFRLTPNMVDAMGITGYEGVFRRVCEVTLRVLREEREMLVSVLQVKAVKAVKAWRIWRTWSMLRLDSTGRQVAHGCD